MIQLLALVVAVNQTAPAQDPEYQSGRPSHLAFKEPSGKAITARRTDSGIKGEGFRAERTITLIADGTFRSGDLILAAEYGRIEVMDSDDGRFHIQIRAEALGEEAAKAIEETTVRTFLKSDGGRIMLGVWHSTQGFTSATQPCWISIRVQVPSSVRYAIDADAEHGCVGVRRLTLTSCRLRGKVGLKTRGIKGYDGGHELDNVTLAGDADLLTESPASFGDVWIKGTIRAAASCNVKLRTAGGAIRLAITPDPSVGVNVVAKSGIGSVLVGVAEQESGPPLPKVGVEVRQKSEGFDKRPIKVSIVATSATGSVSIISAK